MKTMHSRKELKLKQLDWHCSLGQEWKAGTLLYLNRMRKWGQSHRSISSRTRILNKDSIRICCLWPWLLFCEILNSIPHRVSLFTAPGNTTYSTAFITIGLKNIVMVSSLFVRLCIYKKAVNVQKKKSPIWLADRLSEKSGRPWGDYSIITLRGGFTERKANVDF